MRLLTIGVGRYAVLGVIDVGRHVGAAKPVDCLLRVADRQEHPVAVAREDRVQEFPLHSVGILRLVHDPELELRPQHLDEGLLARFAGR